MDDIRKLLAAIKNGRAIPVSMGSFPFDDDEKDKVVVGTIPHELLKRYRKHWKQKEQFDEEMEIFAKQLQLEAQRKIDEKFGERVENLQDERDTLWAEISDAVNIPREENLSIDITNGVITARKKEIAMVKEFRSRKGDESPLQ